MPCRNFPSPEFRAEFQREVPLLNLTGPNIGSEQVGMFTPEFRRLKQTERVLANRSSERMLSNGQHTN